MIEKEQFALWMGILGDRFNRELKKPTMRVLHAQLSAELTTEQFVVGAQRAFNECKFWPTPQELIDFAKPPENPELKGADVFGDILTWNGSMNMMAEARKRLDDVGMRAFLSIGGPARFKSMQVTDEVFARKEFIAAYAAASRDAVEVSRVERILDRAPDSRRLTTPGPRITSQPESVAGLLSAGIDGVTREVA